MRRYFHHFFLSLGMFFGLTTGTFAQMLVEDTGPIPGIREYLRLNNSDHTLDHMRSWQVDYNRDGHMDRIVQAAFAFPGGNAVSFQHSIFLGDGVNFTMYGTFPLPPAGIKHIQVHGDGYLITRHEMRPGDPRCCPSGIGQTILPGG